MFKGVNVQRCKSLRCKSKFIYKETQGLNRWFIMQKIGV